MPEKTSFYQDIYDLVKLIPRGRVTSYGAIAEALGQKEQVRRVGYALYTCTDGQVPAHRVVNRNGVLTGKNHFGGDTMQRLLESEGIIIQKDKVQDFKQKFWNPADIIL